MTPPDRSQKLEAVSKVVEAEITLAWARKSSFEVRAFSLITANLAIVTIYFAIESQLGFTAHTRDSPPRALLVASLVALACSIILAALSVIPRNYPGMERGGLQQYLNEASQDLPYDLPAELIEFRIVQLEGAARSNQLKGLFLVIAFCSLGLGVLCLSAALLLAVWF